MEEGLETEEISGGDGWYWGQVVKRIQARSDKNLRKVMEVIMGNNVDRVKTYFEGMVL